MNSTTFLDGRVTLYTGNCLDVIPTLPATSVDAIATDPPYELGFMNKGWDRSGVAFDPETWRETLRVLKPGGHLLAFGGSRTYHRLACAIEDAGFEIRDQIMWVYGSGFPKSLDVSKAIDKRRDWTALPKLQSAIKAARIAAGISQSEAARRMGLISAGESLGGGGFMWFETGMRCPTREQWPEIKAALSLSDDFDAAFEEAEREITGTVQEWTDRSNYTITSKDGFRRDKPATDAAREWHGWHTALKPAHEPIVLARKPLVGTVAANVVRFGTGALNVDGCRVAGTESTIRPTGLSALGIMNDDGWKPKPRVGGSNSGRWPANLIHDGSDEVEAAFSAFGERKSGARKGPREQTSDTGWGQGTIQLGGACEASAGSASRFFYVAKAGRVERWKHLACNCETVKLCLWQRQGRSHPGQTDGTSPLKDTCESRSGGGSSSSILTYGSKPTGESRMDTRSITETTTNRTTDSKISNSSRRPNTNGCIAGANTSTENGGSLAAFAGEVFQSLPSTFICLQKDGRFTGVVVGATSPLYPEKKHCGGCGGEVRETAHPTQKPEALMRYLCRLICPPGGVIFDPFAGSGSTGRGAVLEGFSFIGVELSPEYAEIARGRIAAAVNRPPERVKTDRAKSKPPKPQPPADLPPLLAWLEAAE